MNIELAKKLLGELRLGGEAKLIEDLDVMAKYKYDHYELYGPGARFFEHLYLWLKQFHSVGERRSALKFIRNHLIFVSQREMQDLARSVYYEAVIPEIINQIIEENGLRKFEYAKAYTTHFRDYLRQCLFIGLSDGAQINFFRRHHVELSQEQILPYYMTSAETYLLKLKEETGHQNFRAVFLIDDFTASGYTLIRKERSGTGKVASLNGALRRVYEHHEQIIKKASSVTICHYISTQQTQSHIKKYLPSIRAEMPGYGNKLKTYAAFTIPEDVRIRSLKRLNSSTKQQNQLLARISKMCDRYYDESFETERTRHLGGVKFGFGQSGLPLVTYSNTPNNTIFLLWVNTRERKESPVFHALFRRIDRHRSRQGQS